MLHLYYYYSIINLPNYAIRVTNYVYMKQVLIICKLQYCLNTKSLEKFLHSHKIPVEIIHRDKMNSKDMKGKDLIIVTGGDGTFLQTSHHIKDSTPLFGLNIDPRNSFGFFAGKNHIQLKTKILKALDGTIPITRLYRLKIIIGKREIPYYVLNELFYANQNPAQVSYYNINGEMQMSSGVIISTAAGSTAWAKNAGGTILPLTSSNFQYVVREPSVNKFPESKNFKKVFDNGDEIIIEDLMGDSFIAIDGTEVSYPLKKNQTLRIKLAPELLNVIIT